MRGDDPGIDHYISTMVTRIMFHIYLVVVGWVRDKDKYEFMIVIPNVSERHYRNSS